jgi:hypothetical protein
MIIAFIFSIRMLLSSTNSNPDDNKSFLRRSILPGEIADNISTSPNSIVPKRRPSFSNLSLTDNLQRRETIFYHYCPTKIGLKNKG